MFEFVRADIDRVIASERKTIVKVGVMLFNPGLHAVLLYRLSRWFYLHHMQPVAVFISYLNSVLTGAQISHRATIGKGFSIYHPQGTVIGATAVIGSYCTLTHGNLIGQAYGDDDRPIIGDNFFAATGAKIVGKINIGNNVRVGPNAVVINSLPDGVTVVATPAKLILGAGSNAGVTDQAAPSANQDAILQRLVPLLRRTVNMSNGIDSIDGSTGLLGEGIGVDSLELLKVVSAIEEEFHLTIDDSKLQVSDFQTVGSLATFIQKRVSP